MDLQYIIYTVCLEALMKTNGVELGKESGHLNSRFFLRTR